MCYKNEWPVISQFTNKDRHFKKKETIISEESQLVIFPPNGWRDGQNSNMSLKSSRDAHSPPLPQRLEKGFGRATFEAIVGFLTVGDSMELGKSCCHHLDRENLMRLEP